MPTYATYLDAPDYLANNSMQVETATLIGGNTTLAAPAVLGATALQVASTTAPTAFPASGTFQAYVLDGLNSETVVASVTDATHLSVPAGTLAAHGTGVSVSSAGVGGCLADTIVRASRMVDSICRQGPDGSSDRSLYALARTERLSGPNSFRASFDPDGTLILRPYHWPVTSVASVSVQQGAQVASAVSLTYLVLPDAARQIEIPQAQVLNTTPPIYPFYGVTWSRNWGFVATVTYTGGPIASAALTSVPDDIRQAAHFLVSDLLGYRQNPTGAAEVRRGDFNLSARLRGDTSGNSILKIQAIDLLAPYTARPGM